ncbi:MAG: mevalonate kinase, partial [Crenarchaeota archaeon]|nr:mevalonate kinase [Thermoproteota archaeon]
MITARAPLVLKLAGEHAVVYGHLAIACSIDRYITVLVKGRDDRRIVMRYGDRIDEYRRDRSVGFFRYVNECIRLVEELHGRPLPGLDITIETDRDVTPGAGLGTSAATCVATIGALCRYLNLRENVAELAHEVELRVQGRASRMDTYTSALGGLTLVREGRVERIGLDVSWLRIGVVLLRKLRSTRELVAHVAELRERYPEMVEKVFALMDYCTNMVLEAVRRRDVDLLGRMVTRCHWLLNMLEVVDYRSNRIITELLNSTNVAGAKISGAGYGGAILFILRSNL